MRRALRIGAWVLGSVLALIVTVVAAVMIAGNTQAGRAFMERSIDRFSDGRVRLSGLAGPFPADIKLAKLELRDERGVWLSAANISVRWSPLALLTRRLKVDTLRLARLDIERAPVSHPSETQKSNQRLPHVDIGRLSIDSLELGPQLAGVRTRLSVGGTAHLVSLEEASAGILAQRIGAQGHYEISLRSDPARVDATVRLEEPAGGALAQLLQVPGLGALSVEARLSGPRNAERLDATARAGELQALAQGSLDLRRRDADLVYRLEAPAMAPRADLGWEHIALQGRWRGAVRAPQADAQLRIERLQIPGATGVAQLSANLEADHGDLAVRGVAEGLVIPGSQPRILADSPLRVQATLRLSDDSRPVQLRLEHRLFSLQAQAMIGAPQGGTFALRVPDLAALAAITGQRLAGKADLKGTFTQSSAMTRLDLDANTDLAAEGTTLTSLLAGPLRLHFSGALRQRTIEVERMTLNGRSLSVSAQGSAERGPPGGAHAVESLRARYEINLTDLAALSPSFGGTLKLAGHFDGPITSFSGQSQLTSGLSLRGAPRETLEARINARGLPSRLSGVMQAQGKLAGAPLELDASFERLAADAFHLAVRRGDWKSAHLEGDLTTGAGAAPGHGTVRLRFERLEDLQSLLGTNIKGGIEGNLSLRPVAGRTYAQLQLDARNIVAANVGADARFSASGPTDALALQMNVRSPDLRGEPASTDAAARLNLSAHELRLERWQANYHGESLRLLAPAEVNFAGGLAVSGLRLGLQNAIMKLDGRLSPALDLHGSAHRIDAPLVNAFVPNLIAQGSCDVDARLSGTSSAPSGLVTVRVSELKVSAARDLQAIDANATARLTGKSAQLDAHVNAGHDSQLALNGTAPLDAAGTLDLKLNGKLDAGVANPWLEAHGERVAGALTLNATVRGAPQTPEMGGVIDLANGDLRDYAQGVHLSQIKAHLTGSQDGLKIESLNARAGSGTLDVTGQIGVLKPKLPFSLHLTASKAQPIASDILTANFDADLKAEGTLRERIDLSGTMNVHRAVIGIPNAMPAEVAVLDVRRPGQAPPESSAHKLTIGLDLGLHAPRQILVQGRGLNAEMGGDLHIRGTTASPNVSGGFEMIRGTFTLSSTKLDFTNGRLSFNGAGLNHKIDPTLDFTAQTTVSDGTATLHITGLADSPQFELSSTPALPQDEILARLLFGESASQLTALQVAQIGAALATLSGAGGSGTNPLAKVQQALGLDKLSVGGGGGMGGGGAGGGGAGGGSAGSAGSVGSGGSAGGSGAAGAQSGTSVEAGRYVSDRVYVGAKQSTSGFSQLEVDVELSKHLKLQTRVGNGTATTQGTTPDSDPGSSIGLMYQFQY